MKTAPLDVDKLRTKSRWSEAEEAALMRALRIVIYSPLTSPPYDLYPGTGDFWVEVQRVMHERPSMPKRTSQAYTRRKEYMGRRLAASVLCERAALPWCHDAYAPNGHCGWPTAQQIWAMPSDRTATPETATDACLRWDTLGPVPEAWHEWRERVLSARRAKALRDAVDENLRTVFTESYAPLMPYGNVPYAQQPVADPLAANWPRVFPRWVLALGLGLLAGLVVGAIAILLGWW